MAGLAAVVVGAAGWGAADLEAAVWVAMGWVVVGWVAADSEAAVLVAVGWVAVGRAAMDWVGAATATWEAEPWEPGSGPHMRCLLQGCQLQV